MNLTEDDNNFNYEDLPDDYFETLSDNVMQCIYKKRKHRKIIQIVSSVAAVITIFTLVNNNFFKKIEPTDESNKNYSVQDFLMFNDMQFLDIVYSEAALKTENESVETDYWQYTRFNDNLLIESF